MGFCYLSSIEFTGPATRSTSNKSGRPARLVRYAEVIIFRTFYIFFVDLGLRPLCSDLIPVKQDSTRSGIGPWSQWQGNMVPGAACPLVSSQSKQCRSSGIRSYLGEVNGLATLR